MRTTRLGTGLLAGTSQRQRFLLAPLVKTFCAFVAVGLIASLTMGHLSARWTLEPGLVIAAQQATATPRLLASDAGMVLNFIKPDKTADFEAVIAKLREGLQKSDKPERKRQAAGWKVFKALEPGANGSVLYVFVMDPAAKGADYTVSSILAEAFPTDVQTLYQQYAGAYATGQNFVNLALVSALGQ